MKKILCFLMIIMMTMFLFGCIQEGAHVPALSADAGQYEGAETEPPEIIYEPEQEPIPETIPEADSEYAEELPFVLPPVGLLEIPPFIPPPVYISEFGRQVAEEFLSEKTTIFTNFSFLTARAETVWDADRRRLMQTGRFVLGVEEIDGIWQQIISYEAPDMYLSPTEAGEWAFFDRQGNRIYDAPWMYVWREDDWSELYYASDFRLFDFNNNGIPDIFIHFNQTFEGGYAGFYRIFRFVDGEYRMLEMQGWISRIHDLFFDSEGRIIVFGNSDYHGEYQYSYLVLTDELAEFHHVAGLDFLASDCYNDIWNAWQKHHWYQSEETADGWRLADSWRNHNPTIFGTDIPLTPIYALTDLRQEIIASLRERYSVE